MPGAAGKIAAQGSERNERQVLATKAREAATPDETGRPTRHSQPRTRRRMNQGQRKTQALGLARPRHHLA